MTYLVNVYINMFLVFRKRGRRIIGNRETQRLIEAVSVDKHTWRTMSSEAELARKATSTQTIQDSSVVVNLLKKCHILISHVVFRLQDIA